MGFGSRTRLRIAWTHGEQDQVSMGYIVYQNEVPKLVHQELLLQTSDFLRPNVRET
ncbi:MAG TPA: hypothetical protein VH196_02665 [Terriglobales bacterium]|nr:hypothetical protein [Terriglobales bacterium]